MKVLGKNEFRNAQVLGMVVVALWRRGTSRAADAPAGRSRHVAPILRRRSGCHSRTRVAADAIAHIPEGRPVARSIKARLTRQCHPGTSNPSVFAFEVQERQSLTQDQLTPSSLGVTAGRCTSSQGSSRPKPLLPATNGRACWTFGPTPSSSSLRVPIPAVTPGGWLPPESDIPLTEPRWVRMWRFVPRM